MTEPTTTALGGWIDRIRAGDRAARNDLLVAVEGRLRELVGRMLRRYPAVRQHAEAGDVYQAACLRLLRALEEVRPDGSRAFFGLAAVQIRRELLDLARYYRTPGRRLVAPPEPDGSDRQWEPPAPAADELERWERFHAAVETLPADEREVVGLRFYHGWPEARIAELLGVSVKTVQRAWKRAIRRLRAEVGGPC